MFAWQSCPNLSWESWRTWELWGCSRLRRTSSLCPRRWTNCWPATPSRWSSFRRRRACSSNTWSTRLPARQVTGNKFYTHTHTATGWLSFSEWNLQHNQTVWCINAKQRRKKIDAPSYNVETLISFTPFGMAMSFIYAYKKKMSASRSSITNHATFPTANLMFCAFAHFLIIFSWLFFCCLLFFFF